MLMADAIIRSTSRSEEPHKPPPPVKTLERRIGVQFGFVVWAATRIEESDVASRE
jgi:hypothetical protein